ncbi:MAG: transposase [Deltaproteobacteria bacterium]|nr:transposase [Deltaproteobacteria bacterium]
MGKASKRQFSNEYKQEAVKLVIEGGAKASEVARDLGIGVNTLYGWLNKARSGLLDPTSCESREAEEVKRLRKEVVKLKREREILKKATAFFASQNN